MMKIKYSASFAGLTRQYTEDKSDDFNTCTHCQSKNLICFQVLKTDHMSPMDQILIFSQLFCIDCEKESNIEFDDDGFPESHFIHPVSGVNEKVVYERDLNVEEMEEMEEYEFLNREVEP